jgi:DNA-binding transcriptional LysR family regulator
VSDRIKQLEKSLNVRLLERSTRQLRLTEAGEMFYARARAAVDSAESAQVAVEAWHEEPSGLLIVSVPPEVTRSDVLAALKLMASRYPKVVVRMLLTTERSDLMRDNIDLAIRVGELENNQLIAQQLSLMSLSLVATRKYLQHHGSVFHPQDLAQHNCIPLADNKVWPWQFTKEGETLRIIPCGHVEVSSVSAGLDLALADMGIAVVPDLMLKNVRDSQLVRLLPEWQFPPSPLSAVYLSKSHLSPKVRAFVEILQEIFS